MPVASPVRARLAGWSRAHRLLLVAAMASAMVLFAAVPAGAVGKPVTPRGFPKAAEALSTYVSPVGCDRRILPGTSALAALLKATYPATSYGMNRTCGEGSGRASEHTDGRAVDWMTSARTASGRARADAVISWLFATDKNHVTFANARRLGVMYVIWDNKIWGAYSTEAGWRPYNNCAATPAASMDAACHRNHVHISLSWEGAMKKTSFWTKKVAAHEYGPCRARDMNWSGRYVRRTTPCPQYPAVVAPAGSSTIMKNLVRFSGITLTKGDVGPAVSAIQAALGIETVGVFGPKTYAAVKAFKAKQTSGVAPNGAVGAGTWRKLMQAKAPKSAPVLVTAVAGTLGLRVEGGD